MNVLAQEGSRLGRLGYRRGPGRHLSDPHRAVSDLGEWVSFLLGFALYLRVMAALIKFVVAF